MSQPKNSTIRDLTDFLTKLKDANIFYKLSDPTSAIMVEGFRSWRTLQEIEFHGSIGQIGVEVFKSQGMIEGSEAIKELFDRFAD